MNNLIKAYAGLRDAGLLIMCAATLWLNQRYVTNDRFTAHEAHEHTLHEDIYKTLAGVDKSLSLLQLANERLTDHESRLRSLERKTP